MYGSPAASSQTGLHGMLQNTSYITATAVPRSNILPQFLLAILVFLSDHAPTFFGLGNLATTR